MYRIGVDLGGTNIAVGAVDEERKIIAKVSYPVEGCKNADDILRLTAKAINELPVDKKEIISIGLAVPGSVDKTNGSVIYTANLPMDGSPAAEILSGYTGIAKTDIYLGNDADSAAVGEFGALENDKISDFVMITLGTGVGGGIIINKKLCCGFNGTGGEIGHMVICADGLPCNCGRKGCFEKYASATALAEMSVNAAKEEPDSEFAKAAAEFGKMNAKFPFDMYKKGDITAKHIVEKYIKYLACGIINIMDILQPEIICIGGGISKEGELLSSALQKYADAEDYARRGKKRCRIVCATLGNDAGIVGASELYKYQ